MVGTSCSAMDPLSLGSDSFMLVACSLGLEAVAFICICLGESDFIQYLNSYIILIERDIRGLGFWGFGVLGGGGAAL